MSFVSFKRFFIQTIHLKIHTYKKDFTLNNLEWLLCNKTQPTNQSINFELVTTL